VDTPTSCAREMLKDSRVKVNKPAKDEFCFWRELHLVVGIDQHRYRY